MNRPRTLAGFLAMRGKTGDKRVNEALQKMLVDYLAAHPNESESAIGKRVGLTKAALNNMKNHAIGGGIKTIVGLSKLFGVTPWDLLRTAMGAGDLPAAVGMPLRLVDGWEEAGLGMPPEVGDTVPPRPIARVDRTEGRDLSARSLSLTVPLDGMRSRS